MGFGGMMLVQGVLRKHIGRPCSARGCEPTESTEKVRSSTRNGSRKTSRRFSTARRPVATGRRPCDECTSRREKGQKPALSEFQLFEDNVLQRAVAMVISAVCEQSFHDFSYGFRPGRSARRGDFALCLRTSTCTKCSMSGSFTTCSHRSKVMRISSGSRTTSS